MGRDWGTGQTPTAEPLAGAAALRSTRPLALYLGPPGWRLAHLTQAAFTALSRREGPQVYREYTFLAF